MQAKHRAKNSLMNNFSPHHNSIYLRTVVSNSPATPPASTSKSYMKKRLLYGCGRNDVDHIVRKTIRIGGRQKVVWMCPFYTTWADMLYRCFSNTFKEKNPTYKNVTVCDEWLSLSAFEGWMSKQDYLGKSLDKDILQKGVENKIYSPDTCVLVHPKVNTFMNDCRGRKGKYPTGCYFHKGTSRFHAQVSNPFTGRKESLGTYVTPEEAHLAWKSRKHELACQLAESEYVDDARVAEALKNWYI